MFFSLTSYPTIAESLLAWRLEIIFEIALSRKRRKQRHWNPVVKKFRGANKTWQGFEGHDLRTPYHRK